MSLGSQVKKYRNAAGCTFAEVEAISGVSTGNINALEKRNSNRSEHAQTLARAFGLTTDQLLDETTDHSDHVREHVNRWRHSKTLPPSTISVSEPTATWVQNYWPFSISPDRVKAALGPDDIKHVDAFILALVQNRESDQGKPALLKGNSWP